eukprot:9881223-Alexandrium_andersonii.AAC.1
MTLSAARSLQKFGASLSRGGRRKRRASCGASGARFCSGGCSEFLQTPSRREGRSAHWVSWDRELLGWTFK